MCAPRTAAQVKQKPEVQTPNKKSGLKRRVVVGAKKSCKFHNHKFIVKANQMRVNHIFNKVKCRKRRKHGTGWQS
jgi:hypothetical protein